MDLGAPEPEGTEYFWKKAEISMTHSKVAHKNMAFLGNLGGFFLKKLIFKAAMDQQTWSQASWCYFILSQ